MNPGFDTLAPSRRLTDGSPAVFGAPRSFTSEQALFRLDLVRSLRMHRRLALGFTLAGVVLAAIYLVRYWSVYTAESLIYIQPTPSAVLEAAPMHWPYNYDPATYDSYIQQQMLSMTRPDVLAGAIRRLNPGVWQQSGESEKSAADRLKGAIEVARVGTSYQVAVTAHASNPDTAAALANAVAASYIENTSHEQKAGDAERLAMLKEERDRIKKELDDDRAEQAALNAQLGVAAIGPVTPEHYDDDIAKIHEDLVKARTDHDEAAARLTAMNPSSGPASAALDAEADQLISTDPGLSSLKQALLARRAALVSHMSGKTPDNPQYRQDQEELQKIDAALESSTGELRAKAAARIEEQLHTDLDRTSGLEARLNGELAQMTRAAASATPKLQRLSDLGNDIARLQTRYNAVDEQWQNQTLEDSAPGLAHLAEAAVPPSHPSLIGVIRNALILLFMFIGLGLAAAVAAHKMDPRIYVASDVEHLLSYAPMAQLPDFDEVSGDAAEEHLLRLASGIEYACKDGQLSSCVFTGTGPGVGVTTIARRVQEMLGVLGTEAVLVDATGPVPQERRSDASGGPAMTGADSKRSSLSTALATHADEEAASGREVLLLTDTAPLTVSAEAEYLARRADCIILVIESARTTRAQLRAAAGSLQRMDAAAVGFVLNRVSLKNADASFRHSVSEVERHLRVQGRMAARAVAQIPRVVPEAALASPARNTPALEEKPVARAVLASPAVPAGRPATPASPAMPERVAAAPAPLPQPAPFMVAEDREAPALARAALGWSAAQPARPAAQVRPVTPERVAVSPAPLPKLTPFAVVEKWEAQHLHQAAPVVPASPQGIQPVSSSAAKTAAQPLDETVALPIPERMPVITGSQEAPNLEPTPIFRADTEEAAEVTSLPKPNRAAATVPKFAAKPIEKPAQQPDRWAVTRPDRQAPEETPWWLTDTPTHAETALIQPRAPRVGTWPSVAPNGEQEPAAPEEREKEAANFEAPTRLSGLRGVLFPFAIKESGLRRDAEQIDDSSGKDEGIVSAPPADAVAADPEQAVAIETLTPRTEHEPVHAKVDGTVARGGAPRWVTAEPEFLPPRQESADKDKESRLKKTSHDEDDFGDIQILPARRGQYRR
jgi:uncharacterized protein involved in exopolysaccharide biosynthesis